MEEKARVESEAREREAQQLLEAHQRQKEEEEEALKQELLRLKELQLLHSSSTSSKKKKKEHKVKEAACTLTKPETSSPSISTINNPQPLHQSARNVLENLQNGKRQLLHTLVCLKEPVKESPKEPPKELVPPALARSGPSSPRRGKEKPADASPVLSNGTMVHSEARTKIKPHSPRIDGEAVKRPAETPRKLEPASKSSNTTTEAKSKVRPAEEQLTEAKKEERTFAKKQQNGLKEERISPVGNSPVNEPNGKAVQAESPQPKSKAKKNKKKKADKMNNSIGEWNKGVGLWLRAASHDR